MHRLMTRSLLLLLLLTHFSLRADETAGVRVLAGTDEAVWVGEQVDVYLELWTADISFSAQSFVLPQVSGGYLLQPDSTTVKLSERRGGESWQGLRYILVLYPQRAGEVEVPPFEVRFSTSAGYGSEPKTHVFQTNPLSVTADMPPGAKPGSLQVTSTNFRFRAVWEPLPLEGGVLELRTGDAVVLSVDREAAGVPGMVFEPLPEIAFDGLGVYVDTPRVDDRVNRGDLTGIRSDRVTLVCELPGRYEIPEFRFQWWDPEREQLHQETIPALSLEVSQNPAFASLPADGRAATGFKLDWRWIWVMVAGLLLWWPGRFLFRGVVEWLGRALKARRLVPLNPTGRSE